MKKEKKKKKESKIYGACMHDSCVVEAIGIPDDWASRVILQRIGCL